MSNPSAEKQSVYSTAPADWAIDRVNDITVSFSIIQFSIVNNLDVKTVLFRANQFSTNTQFKCQKKETQETTV